MSVEHITSAQNPLIKHIKKLQNSRSYRQDHSEFVADGWKLLDEALKCGITICSVITSDLDYCPELPGGVRTVVVPQSLMQSLSTMKTPQGVVFTCKMPTVLTPQIKPGMLLLDRIQDPGNLGTILRTADAFGVKVLLTNGCADPFSEKTIRASMGAVLRTPPVSIELNDVLQSDIPLAVTALSAISKDIRDFDLNEYLVVVGSEGQGVCEQLLNRADMHLIIPMQPRCESLNAGIAASIVMWQMMK